MQGFSHFTVSKIEMWLNQSNLTDGLFLLENVLLYPTISAPLEARKYGIIIFISIISLAFPFILEWWRRDGWWVGLWTGEVRAELGGWLESVREKDFWVLVDYSLITFYCMTTRSWDIVLLLFLVNTLPVYHMLEWLPPPDGPMGFFWKFQGEILKSLSIKPKTTGSYSAQRSFLTHSDTP